MKEREQWKQQLIKYQIQAIIGLFIYLISCIMIFFY